MKALLCVPPPVSPDHPLMGIATVSAVLRSYGIAVEVLDLNAQLASCSDFSKRYWRKEGIDSWARSEFLDVVQPIIDKMLEEILSGREPVDIFGLHVSSASRATAARIAKRVKACRPEMMIIAGGPDFFDSPHQACGIESYDVVFFGEAEASLAHWIKEGRFSRRQSGVVKISGKTVNLNTFPMPFYGHFPMSVYARGGVLPMETSRGCVNNCSFCDDSRMWKRYRRKSDQRIKEELEALIAFGARQISFCDSVLNPSLSIFHNLLQLLAEAGLSWDGMVQASKICPETAKLMRHSNCAGIFIGIESFSRPFLRLLNKEHSAIHGQNALEYLAAEGVNTSMGLIIAGPPLQSRRDFEHDLEILRQMAPSLTSVAINPLCIPEGTALAENGAAMGIQGLGSRLSWKFWHAGRGIEDLRQRLEWCREAAKLLAESGVSLGANYLEFDLYLADQLCDAENHFRGKGP